MSNMLSFPSWFYLITSLSSPSLQVSINPFKFFPALYTPELIETHLNLPPGEISKPHVFQIAAAAFHGLRGERTNQSIVISGESGAGKTEATKKCLQFFASAAGSAAEGIQDRLLSANPILEGFGNAKTVRNNNSSRFGKWMEVHFNSRAQICGCSIINYLLEKSRVVFQAQQERNYHIFYMLSAAAPSELRTRLALSGPENYAFTSKSNCIVVDNMSDHELFEELSEAFDSVGFKKVGLVIIL
jgi:myosin heavy subunit